MAISKPTEFPKSRCRGAGGVRPRADLRVCLDGREATSRQVVADRRDERLGQPATARIRGRRDAGDDGGKRGIGERRIEVARPSARAGTRSRARTARTPSRRRHPAGPWRSCRRHRGRDRATGASWARRGRPSGGPAASVRRGSRPVPGRRPRPASGTGWWAVRSRTDWRPAPWPRDRRGTGSSASAAGCQPRSRRRAPATTGAPPSTRDRRPPSSRTTDGRSRGRRTAGCGQSRRIGDVEDGDRAHWALSRRGRPARRRGRARSRPRGQAPAHGPRRDDQPQPGCGESASTPAPAGRCAVGPGRPRRAPAPRPAAR